MKIRTGSAALLAVLFVSACGASLPDMPASDRVSTRNEAPPWAAPGTCWSKDETPAVIETRTRQAADDSVVRSAASGATGAFRGVYTTQTRQRIVTPRKDTWFETPCAAQLTPQFTASLQRALKARGYLDGPITGRMDSRTRSAIRAYQKPKGLDSATISLAAARQMGLVTVAAQDASRHAPVPLGAIAGSPREARNAAANEAVTRTDTQTDVQTGTTTATRSGAQKTAEAQRGKGPDEQAATITPPPVTKAERARKAAQLEAALKAEKDRESAKATPLPISAETY